MMMDIMVVISSLCILQQRHVAQTVNDPPAPPLSCHSAKRHDCGTVQHG